SQRLTATMLSSDLPRVLLLLTAVELSWGSLSDEDERMILQMHNLYRSQVSPPAADMQNWDPDLGAFAKAYAEKCIWDHNKDRGRRGENLFIMMEELDLQLAMEDWHGEYQYYNLTTTKCAMGHMCGHYTQVVWANTLRIGCGAHFCETVEGIEERDMHLLVCNYEPPGNIRGRKPYREGSPCSLCPEGYKCINSMCGKDWSGNNGCELQLSLQAPFLLPTGAKEMEEISPDGHRPKTSSASNILELSFLLLASSLLRALLL
uniref:Peptidase inhibitor 16 n=1 Tax=Crocodylus porosus TaxID=8502 RepID=A0A7M4E4Y4_CROPO